MQTFARVAPGFQLYALARFGWNDSRGDCACEERAARADWIPASAGNAGFARFQCCNINGVILGLVPRMTPLGC